MQHTNNLLINWDVFRKVCSPPFIHAKSADLKEMKMIWKAEKASEKRKIYSIVREKQRHEETREERVGERWFPAKHWAKASETKQNSFSRQGLHINTAAHSTGMLITVARCTFCLCNIWAVCLSYTELDMHSLKLCVVYLSGNVCMCACICVCVCVCVCVCTCTSIQWPHHIVVMMMCDGEEYQPWLRRMMINASFTAGIPIRPAEGADSGTGHFHLPAWVKEGLNVAWWLKKLWLKGHMLKPRKGKCLDYLLWISEAANQETFSSQGHK